MTADKSSTGDVKDSDTILEHASHGFSVSTPHLLQKDRTSIDDFETIKRINRGAFGKVFLARKRTTGDFFAIKVDVFSFRSVADIVFVLPSLCSIMGVV